MHSENFTERHIGPSDSEIKNMLECLHVNSLDELVQEVIPGSIRLKKPISIGDGLSEHQLLDYLKEIGNKNKIYRSFIGLGYYGTLVPPVIQRNVLENPGWYTAYTPYQAEISQGRLEALLNFQTMVIDLVGLPVANASLLDEATAAAEAMILLYNARSREAKKNNRCKFFVDQNTFPQTIEVLKTRAEPLGIELEFGDWENHSIDNTFFGVLFQYPNADGNINNYESFCAKLKQNEISIAVGADLLSLTLLKPPGEWGADVVFGNSQRFGVPLGYGGPHAAFFATKEDFKRFLPGRIIGVSVDADGKKALRMALQTREQHIKRERATSNICTAQALLAIMASMYAVYHGPKGLKNIALKVHGFASQLANAAVDLGYSALNTLHFDTIHLKLPDGRKSVELKKLALSHEFNFRYPDQNSFSISIDETFNDTDYDKIVSLLINFLGKSDTEVTKRTGLNLIGDSNLKRDSSYLTHPTFNKYHSETEMMRYIKRLENKDLSLTHSMISLGSCTMKLNAVAELYPISWSEFSDIHPFVPIDQALGYAQIIDALSKDLVEITGLHSISFQPNSGAQGEYAGLMVIRAYHRANDNKARNVALIPASSHGTNPASAAMAGMKIVIVKCDSEGNIDINDLKEKAKQHKDSLACLMVTYPSTHGVYEERIKEITDVIHSFGGQVYMDGANMNAQVGLTSPGEIGADVCHLNLHKTFAIPHGGGGPGMGPIAVAKHLTPYLPSHPLVSVGTEDSISSVSAAPFGSALILLISYAYLKLLGSNGATQSTKVAILNANYLKHKLEPHYNILYCGKNARVAHEMILDCKEFKKRAGVEVSDIAKRLVDYGFHAPTVAFPVQDTLMVEPTESESKEELDRFSEALISIKAEIEAIEANQLLENNLLKNAPHTAEKACGNHWDYPYSREEAVFPLTWVRKEKFWPSVGRVNNAVGDRNLVCSCPPIEDFEEVMA